MIENDGNFFPHQFVLIYSYQSDLSKSEQSIPSNFCHALVRLHIAQIDGKGELYRPCKLLCWLLACAGVRRCSNLKSYLFNLHAYRFQITTIYNTPQIVDCRLSSSFHKFIIVYFVGPGDTNKQKNNTPRIATVYEENHKVHHHKQLCSSWTTAIRNTIKHGLFMNGYRAHASSHGSFKIYSSTRASA